MRTALIGAQFAAAGVLLIVVIVMLAQKDGLRRITLRPGEDPVVMLQAPPFRADSPAGQQDFMESLRAQLLTDPAITGVTFRGAPVFATMMGAASDYAQSLDPGARRVAGQARSIYYSYFETMSVPILAGREFSRDMDESRSVMIDKATAEAFGLTPEQAVGQPIYRVASLNTPAPGATPPAEFTIIGVTEREPLELRATGPTNYLYVVQPVGSTALVRLSAENVDGGIAHIRDVWRQRNPDSDPQPQFLDTAFDGTYRAFNMINGVFMVLSGIAAAIAAMGLFGVASFIVQRRMREVGVRKTLGASSLRVLGLMVWDFSKPVIVANVIAWPIAWLAARAYLNLFVTRIDLTPWPFLASLGVSLLIAWIAVGAHAIRAARVKPAVVLAAE